MEMDRINLMECSLRQIFLEQRDLYFNAITINYSKLCHSSVFECYLPKSWISHKETDELRNHLNPFLPYGNSPDTYRIIFA